MNDIHQRLFRPAGQFVDGGAGFAPSVQGGDQPDDSNIRFGGPGGRPPAQPLSSGVRSMLDWGGGGVSVDRVSLASEHQQATSQQAASDECFDPTAISTPAGADAFYRAHPQCMPEGWRFTTPDPGWWKPWAIGAGVLVGGVVVVSLLARRRK